MPAEQTVNRILVIGLFVAFGFGYLVGGGRDRGPTVIQPTVPSNYDPVRAFASDTIKGLQDSNEHCWQHVTELLTERARAEKTAH